MGRDRMSDDEEGGVEIKFQEDIPEEEGELDQGDESYEDFAQKENNKTNRTVLFIRLAFVVVAFILGITVASLFHWWFAVDCETTSYDNNNSTTRIMPISERHYGVVFDLGSGGSRGYVYTWKEGERVVLGPHGGAPSWWLRVQGGVSGYGDGQDAANSLKPILDFCQQKLEEVGADLDNVPIFLLGTAGLRSLPSDQAEAIMESIRDLVETYPFHFQRNFAEILTDFQEGTYEWRSAQYLVASLSSSPTDLCDYYGVGNSAIDCNNYQAPTLGVLGIGGQSAQVSFCSADHLEGYTKTDVSSMGYKNCDNLYISSDFVGFEHATYKYTLPHLISEAGEEFLKQEGTEKYLSHPCLHSGFVTNIEYQNGRDFFSISLSGGGDYEACLSMLESLLEEKDIGPSVEDFTMIFLSSGSNSRRLREFFGLNFMYQPQELKQRAASFCSLDWLSVMDVFGEDGGPQTFDYWSGNRHDLIDYCPQALWLYSLSKKLGFRENHPQNLITPEIQGYFSDWTTAALLSHLPRFPSAPLPALQ